MSLWRKLMTGALTALVLAPASASAASDGVQHLHFRYGPVNIAPGQNVIKTDASGLFRGKGIPQPRVDGYVTKFDPNLRYVATGKVPPVDVIHLHHGVWLSSAETDATSSFGGVRLERFAAAGEEKTKLRVPKGFGYVYKTSDRWVLNYMIHNLTPTPTRIWITYDVDIIPKTAPQARGIRAVRPIWMDVQNGSIYPVFDVLKGTGHRGRYTYPTDAKNPYPAGVRKNTWTVDRDGVLVGTAGHLHPGGLHTDLYVSRAGRRAHVFRSSAHYWEPAGAVSWDVAMTATKPDWRVQVHKGDVLSTTATYDAKRASWYESMGIMVTWMADGTGGLDPFTTKVDQPGVLTHGHLAENNHHGGESTGVGNPLNFANGPAIGTVGISRFLYGQGDVFSGGRAARPPVVRAGRSITFVNKDETGYHVPVWHTITACHAPCNKATGVAYPLADGSVNFDSGQLGTGGAPTVNRLTWQTPKTLRTGTYTYFCRVHPFMRGAFRVVR